MPEATELVGQQTPAGIVEPATVAPVTEDISAIKAQNARLLKHKEELEGDLKKYRARIEDEAKKAKDAGDFAKLLEIEREKAAGLEARLTELTGFAEIGKQHADRAAKEVEAAAADPTLPAFVKRAITAARSPMEAAEVLQAFRAEAKPNPPASPALGAAPTHTAVKNLDQMDAAEILRTPKADLEKAMGKATDPGGGMFRSLFFR